LCVALPYWLGDCVPFLSLTMESFGRLGFVARIVQWTALAGVVIFPAAVVAGYQFPLLIGLLGSGSREVGAQTGFAYAWNTTGAIAGSLAGGFGLLPWLTAPGVWRCVVVLLAALSAATLVVAERSRGTETSWKSWVVAGPTAACALLLLTAMG